jgi:flagellar secretion chaperone FliS
MLHSNALKAYEQVEQDFMVESANRHRLVEILFTELLASIDRALMGLTVNDHSARSAGVSKALTIVYSLRTSLDFERGGKVASSLADLYDWARMQLLATTKDRPTERLTAVRSSISEIAEAWSSIANPVD